MLRSVDLSRGIDSEYVALRKYLVMLSDASAPDILETGSVPACVLIATTHEVCRGNADSKRANTFAFGALIHVYAKRYIK